MPLALLREWWQTRLARQRLDRLRCETAARLLESAGPQRVADEPDACRWQLLGAVSRAADEADRQQLRDQARQLAEKNPYARNALLLYRNYVLGAGMKHEVTAHAAAGGKGLVREQLAAERVAAFAELWHEFLEANDWATGNRKDWEFCQRVWRDGECFLRLFRQPIWPPLVHFVDPEWIGPAHPLGEPSHGIETLPGNVEVPTRYHVLDESGDGEWVDAELMLHTKIGVDGNVKRGLSIFLPVLDMLKRFQGWLDVELIQRKVASSIVLVRKHERNHPAGLAAFADAAADSAGSTGSLGRRLTLQPGSIIDAQGFDLQFLSPNTHFDDASLLGRMMLLAISAGLGLPEFMLSSDASNSNYASTLVAEGPAVRHFAAWQSFFIGQWRKLFRRVLAEAVRLGLATAEEAGAARLNIIPPPLAVRQRLEEARADAIYFDRGVLSRRELARRDQADPDQMFRERSAEIGRGPAAGGTPP